LFFVFSVLILILILILGSEYQSRYRILLTGTPLQNNLPELWALLNFLLPAIFSSIDSFDQWFNKPFASFRNAQHILDKSNDDNIRESETSYSLSTEEQLLIVHRLHEVLRPFMLRRVKLEVLDQLPDKTELVIRCDLSRWQKELYKAIADKGIANRDSRPETGGLNNIMMQLRKVCNHPYLFLKEWIVDEQLIRASGKFELLDRILPKLYMAGHRILMFSQMTQLMTILDKYFEKRGFKALRLDGSTNSDEREKRMHMFNDPDSPYFIFLLSTRAGGLGLNLATADTVILFDSDWNPMMDAQAQDRAHRIGQKNEVRVFRLISASPIEEKILSRAQDKQTLNNLVIESAEFSKQGSSAKAGLGDTANKNEMESLLNEYAGGGSDEAEIMETISLEPAVGLPTDDDINRMMAVSSEEFALYQKLDQERPALKLERWRQVCPDVLMSCTCIA
jgi:ATP-dependent helicase STH1/SNF2